MRYPSYLLQLIESLKKLPGVGSKSAERFAFELMRWPKEATQLLGSCIATLPEKICYCQQCGALAEQPLCSICIAPQRNAKQLCIVASCRDLFALESTGEYRGLYHVLGALLSPLDGIGTEQLPLLAIKERIAKDAVQEIILALDATLEGDATALYLKQALQEELQVKISRLACGLPMGSSFDYVDGGTLAIALNARSHF